MFKKNCSGKEGKKEKRKVVCVEVEVVSNGKIEWKDGDGKTRLDLIIQASKKCQTLSLI